MPDLCVALGPLTLKNPILAAAGTYGYGLEFARAVPLARLGAVTIKTLTRRPREGHRPPRLVETPAGLLNAVGLQNVGIEPFLTEQWPALRRHGATVIISLLGESPEELAEMAGLAEQADGIAAVELNLSCPNLPRQVEGGRWKGEGRIASTFDLPPSTGLMVAQDPEATGAFVRAARAATRKPLIAKLSPDVTDVTPIARAAQAAGADALSLGNTFTGMSLDPQTRRSRLGRLTGGLSGPAIRPLAVYRVWYTARSVELPVIGLGGVRSAEDALEFFLAGATAVGVGTANFSDPRAPLRILRELERWFARRGVASIEQFRGTLQGPEADGE